MSGQGAESEDEEEGVPVVDDEAKFQAQIVAALHASMLAGQELMLRFQAQRRELADELRQQEACCCVM